MVKGSRKLRRKLTVTFPKMVLEAVSAAMEKGATEVVVMMKSLVPVEEGDLRDSIGWTWGAAPAGSISLGKISGREYKTVRITIYAGSRKAYWARWQEFGTQNHAATPYFYVSWRFLRRRIRGRITRATNKAIKKANSL